MKIQLTYEQLQKLLNESKAAEDRDGPARRRGVPIPGLDYYLINVRDIFFRDIKEAAKHAKVLSKYLNARFGAEMTQSVADAFDYFQFLVDEENVKTDSYGWGDAEYVIGTPSARYDVEIKHFKDELNLDDDKMLTHIVRLRKLLMELALEIEKANNSMAQDADINATRAYIQAFLAFIDTRNVPAQRHIPGGLARGLEHRMKETDWSKVSSTANGISTSIEKLLKLLYSIAGFFS